MLSDPKVLRAFGTTNQQLRQYFTATGKVSDDATDEVKAEAKINAAAKAKFTEWLRRIILDARYKAFKEYQFYVSADLARDGPPISPETVPLRAFAQGRVKLVDCEREIQDLSPSTRDKFLTTTEVPENPAQPLGPGNSKKVTEANLIKLEEVCISICRAYVDRRVDAQCNLYNNLEPFFKFEPRDTSSVGRLRGEAMGAYTDIMAESYGWKHKQRQAIRGMLMYGHCLMFPASAWDYETRPVPVADNVTGDDIEVRQYLDAAGAEHTMKLRSKIVREGLDMTIVHPCRTIYDRTAPLATINHDTGSRYVGFWDVKRYGDICGNPAYFNTDRVPIGAQGQSIYQQNQAFFSLIFPGQPINFPAGRVTGAPGVNGGTVTDPVTGTASTVIDVAGINDAKANQGLYTSAATEASVFVTDIRVKVVPRDHGMGEYPRPVWLRLLVAGDNTVIYAEWMPSLPAVYFGHNEDDAKVLNLSQMHEIMWAQDTLTNIMSNLLMTMKRQLAQIIVVNKDVFGNDDEGKRAYQAFQQSLNGDNFYQRPHLMTISGLVQERLEKGGFPKLNEAIVAIVSPTVGDANYMTNAFRAVALVLSLLERLMALSPQEQGQPANHEISAEEVAAINRTTEGKFSAISESVDEARAAQKRLVDEASLAYGSNTIELAVVSEFSDETIEAAGFKKKEGADYNGALAKPGLTLVGTREALVHDYTYSTRDGANRMADAQRANLILNFVNAIVPLIGKEGIGKKRLFELANLGFRAMGVPDMKLEMQEGESEDLRSPEELQATQQSQQQQQADAAQMQQAINAQGQALMQQGANTQKAIMGLTAAIAKMAGVAAPTSVPAAPIAEGEIAPGVPAAPGAMPEMPMEQPISEEGAAIFAEDPNALPSGP